MQNRLFLGVGALHQKDRIIGDTGRNSLSRSAAEVSSISRHRSAVPDCVFVPHCRLAFPVKNEESGSRSPAIAREELAILRDRQTRACWAYASKSTVGNCQLINIQRSAHRSSPTGAIVTMNRQFAAALAAARCGKQRKERAAVTLD